MGSEMVPKGQFHSCVSCVLFILSISHNAPHLEVSCIEMAKIRSGQWSVARPSSLQLEVIVHMCNGCWPPTTVSQTQDTRMQSYKGISYFKNINRALYYGASIIIYAMSHYPAN